MGMPYNIFTTTSQRESIYGRRPSRSPKKTAAMVNYGRSRSSLGVAMAGSRRSLLILCLFLSVLFRHTVQSEDDDDLVFLTQPPPTFYSYISTADVEHVAMFQCIAARRDGEGTETIIDAVIYKNSESINKFYPPSRHQAWANEDHKVIGIIVGPTKEEDTGNTYHCEIHRGDEVIQSVQTTLYVGDGTPFPVTGVSQLSESLYTIKVSWDKAPAPDDAPINGYNLSITEVGTGEQFELVADGNDTDVVLFHLLPGEEYRVTVAGYNRHGEGQSSEEITIATVKSDVPSPPPSVTIEVEITNTSSSITVSWELPEIDPESMTPIQYYAVYLRSPKNVINVNTTDNVTTSLTISDILVGGNYSVGVAAINSAGQSTTTLYGQGVAAICYSLSVPANTVVMVTMVGSAVVAEYSCREGYQLLGSQSRECLSDGVWEGTNQTCIELLPDFQPESSSESLGVAIIAGAAGGGAIFIIIIVVLAIVMLVVCYNKRKKSKTVEIYTYGVPGSDSPGSVKKLPVETGLGVEASITESTVVRYVSTTAGSGTGNGAALPDSALNGGSTFGK